MWVRRSDWERVTEREELVGRLSLGSRFPQYFITAMLTGAVVLALWISVGEAMGVVLSGKREEEEGKEEEEEELL